MRKMTDKERAKVISNFREDEPEIDALLLKGRIETYVHKDKYSKHHVYALMGDIDAARGFLDDLEIRILEEWSGKQGMESNYCDLFSVEGD